MQIELRVPELGENIESAGVSRLLVKQGDTVEVDQSVVEIETEKATADVPATHAGVVTEMRVAVGDTVPVGAVILTMEAEEAAAPPATPEAAPEAPPDSPAPEAVAAKPVPAAPASEMLPGQLVPAAPHVRRLARELGVDVSKVAGTGPGGRITRDDVKGHVRRNVATGADVTEPPLPDFSVWGTVRREPMSTIRRKTAENLSRAWRIIPHVTQCDEADVTHLETLRRRFAKAAESRGGKLTITAIVVRAVAGALRAFPTVNASVDGTRSEIVYKDYVNVGVAADTERGLLVPVVKDADAKSVVDLAVELTELSARAREGKLKIDEMQGATFTVSNLGGLGTTHFSPIVNWPEVAILGVSRAQRKPVWQGGGTPEGGQFVPRLMLPLSLSYDHRVIDGALAARFIVHLSSLLGDLRRLLL